MYTIQMNGPSLRGKPYQVNTFSFSSAPIQAFGYLSVPAQKKEKGAVLGAGKKECLLSQTKKLNSDFFTL